MKWIGQHIYDLISRFRSDVYLEDINTGTIASGGNLGLDSNNKIVKATEATGDITGVDLTGTSPINIGSETGTTSGDYSATISVDTASTTNKGVVELATTAETTTGTDTGRAVTPDGLKDGYQGSTNVVTVGTIGTGDWRGTPIIGTYIDDDTIDSQHYADGSIDTAHIADDQVTFAKASGVTPNVYGNKIKVLPSDFMANEEGSVTKTIQYVDNNANGLKPGHDDTELLAFVSIPEGMKATHVEIHDDADLGFEVFEARVDQAGITSKGTGTANTIQALTSEVDATAYNFLLIRVSTVNKTDRVFGGEVTIAAQ